MSHSVDIPLNGTKRDLFEAIIPQIESLTKYETNRTASLANVVAVIKEVFNHFWVGFYLLDDSSSDKLVLNVFQGTVACSRIPYGKGVCGSSWKEARTIVVEDVNKFEGHIACSSKSQSEIVLPIIKNGKVVGVLDIDSEELATFDGVDEEYYTIICKIVADYCF